MAKPPRVHPETSSKRDRKNGDFAREITRAEFGRFYWDDERAREVRRACPDWKKPPPK